MHARRAARQQGQALADRVLDARFVQAVGVVLVAGDHLGERGGQAGGAPVSYTHLDVYKRQA